MILHLFSRFYCYRLFGVPCFSFSSQLTSITLLLLWLVLLLLLLTGNLTTRRGQSANVPAVSGAFCLPSLPFLFLMSSYHSSSPFIRLPSVNPLISSYPHPWTLKPSSLLFPSCHCFIVSLPSSCHPRVPFSLSPFHPCFIPITYCPNLHTFILSFLYQCSCIHLSPGVSASSSSPCSPGFLHLPRLHSLATGGWLCDTVINNS